MLFHESFGDVTKAQLTAYKKHNVSPADHDELVMRFGLDHNAITDYVKSNAAQHNGMFQVFDLYLGR